MLKTIVIVNDTPNPTGGSAIVAIHSAVHLRKKGLRVIFFSGIENEDPSIEGVEVISLGHKDILNNPSRVNAFFNGLWNKEAKIQFESLLVDLDKESTIIHFHSWSKCLSSSLFEITEFLGFKIVITLHDYFTFCPNGGIYNYREKHICEIVPGSFACLCSNCDSRNYFHKLWRFLRLKIQDKYLFSNNPINFITISKLNEKLARHYLPSNAKFYQLDNPIKLGKSVKIETKRSMYLFIGRLSTEKGIDLFCEAITNLSLFGIVIGTGDLLDEYKEKYPMIDFVGWKDHKEMEEYIKAAKAFVFTSLLYEASPLTTKELSSYGVPLIIPDKNAAIEDVIDGVTGFIFRSGDLDSLQNALLKMEIADSNVFSSNIVSNFDYERYSMNNHIRNLLNIYNKILH